MTICQIKIEVNVNLPGSIGSMQDALKRNSVLRIAVLRQTLVMERKRVEFFFVTRANGSISFWEGFRI